MNAVQRVGLFVGLVALLCILLFHSPWTGYETSIYHPGNEVTRAFGIQPSIDDLEVLEWHTKEPLVVWFATLYRVLVSVLFVCVVTALWLFLFKTRRQP